MSHSEHDRQIPFDVVPIQGDVTGAPARNQQFTKTLFCLSADERVFAEDAQPPEQQLPRRRCSVGLGLDQKCGEALDILQGARREDESSHGTQSLTALGRLVRLPASVSCR